MKHPVDADAEIPCSHNLVMEALTPSVTNDFPEIKAIWDKANREKQIEEQARQRAQAEASRRRALLD